MRRVLVKCAALAALACVATMSSLETASAGLLYNPIVTQYGDGTTLLTSTVAVPATICLYQANTANQLVSSVSYPSRSWHLSDDERR